MKASNWADRGDSAAREDIRAGNVGEWSKGAVLAHLGIFDETDTEAVACGLTGDDLDAAQRAALAGFGRAMEGA